MINLTKPIRRKYDHTPVEMVRETRHVFRILDGSSLTSYPMLPHEAELIFENVPELCKPREGWLAVGRIFDSKVDAMYAAMCQKTQIVTRVIEWPVDAPLPELPK